MHAKSRKFAHVVSCAQENKIRAQNSEAIATLISRFYVSEVPIDPVNQYGKCRSNVNVIETTNTKGILCWGSYVFICEVSGNSQNSSEYHIAKKLVINRDTLVLAFLAFSQNLPAMVFRKVNFRSS